MTGIMKLFSLVLVFVVSTTTFVFAGNLDETPEIQFTSTAAEDLFNQATKLNSSVNIYEYVRNNYEYTLYHGSRSGSINTFLGGRGNDVDLASTLIAMLRSQGIPSEYVVGTIEVASADLTNWLGVKDIDLAVSLLDDQGIQKVIKNTDTVQFEHVWIRAQVAFDNYRGAGSASSVDCAATPEHCIWIDLDPSYKLRQYHNQNIDIYNTVNFDYTAYYDAIKDNAPVVKDKNPLEIYEEQILEHLQNNHPGKTLEDIADPGVIIKEENQILPASLPYAVIGSVETYDSIAAHDAIASKDWAKYATAKLDFGCFNATAPAILLSELTTKRFTLTYELGSPQRLVFRLDGVDYFVPLTMGTLTCNGTLVDVGYPFSMTIDVDGAPGTQGGTDNVISVEYNNLVVGGYYLIGTGGDSSNWSQVHRAAEQLLSANEQFPIVNDPEGVPYIDNNPTNGSVDTAERRLLDSPTAQDALTGGILYSAMSLYFARFHDNLRRLDSLNHITSPIEGFVGVVSSVYDVEYLDETAFSVMPGGLLIDMKGQVFNGFWRNNAPEDFADEHFELLGHSMSSLEHEIWQEITGFDAVSTVRGTQMAVGNNDAIVLNPKKNTTEDTLAAFYTGTGFETQAPNPFTKHERTVFSTRMVTWSVPNNGQTYEFETFLGEVDTNTSSLRLSKLTYNSDNGLDSYIKNINDIENTFLANPNGLFNATICGVSYTNKPGSVLLGHLETCYFSTLATIGQDFVDYLDKNKGFVPGDYVYRASTGSSELHSSSTVQQFRNNISLITTNHWREYVIPSVKTSGNFFQFSVYLDKVHDLASNDLVSLSFQIANESISAGGGYVDGTEAIEPASAGAVFDNESFNDQTLNKYLNNDLVITPSTVDPVSTVTGNMYHDETDVTIKGRGLNLSFTRTYNSSPVKEDSVGLPLGFNWTHSYNMSLKSNDFGQFPNYDVTQAPENFNSTTSSITYMDERGGEVNYLVDDTGGTPSYAVTPPKTEFNDLALDTPSIGLYTLTFRNGTKYIFDSQGTDLKVPSNTARLSSIEDAYGNQLIMSYDGSGRLSNIVDNLGIAGRTGLTFLYNAKDQLETVSDWTGRDWGYTYDTDGNLDSMTNPLSQEVDYTYHPDTKLLHQVILPEDRNGKQVNMAYNYYRNNKAFNYINALGDQETLDYDIYRKRTRVTDPRGFIREYHYNSDGALTKLTEPDGAIMLFENTPDGLRYNKTDGLGYETFYSYQQDRAINNLASDTNGLVTLEQDALGQTIEYDYGIYDQQTRIQDKKGHERLLSYYTTTDPATNAVEGKLKTVSVILGGTTVELQRSFYFPDGNLKELREWIEPTNPSRQRRTKYTYTDNGLNVETITVTGVTSGTPVTTTYTYDSLGRKETETVQRQTSPTDAMPISLMTTTEYDDLGRETKVTGPRGDIAETVYDNNGQVTQEKIHHKLEAGGFDIRTYATHEYDAADRRIKTTDINGNETHFTYDNAGNLTSTTDANDHTTLIEYDSMNRQTAIIDANGHRTESAYDLAGRLVKTIDANGNAMTYEYDALGRQTKTITPLGFETHAAYDANNNLTHLTDANAIAGTQAKNTEGNSSVFNIYDELNRLIRSVNAENGETLTSYDLLGNITSITDAEGQTTQMIYDDMGRPIQLIDPLIESPTDKTVTITYDEVGNRLTSTDRNGEEAQYTYDTLNRLIKTDYLTDGTSETYSYDDHGNLKTLVNDEVTYSYLYDTQNRLIQKTDSRTGKTLNWQYDAVGNIQQKTDYQSDITEYQYDSTNRLVSMSNNAYLQVSYHYDPAGRLLNRIMSNGAKTNYSYDNNNRLLSLENLSADGTVVHSQSYQYDHTSNITQITDSTGDTTYTYDPSYRLTNADAPGTANDHSYTYDLVGNRETHTQETNSQETTWVYIYNQGNRLLEIRDGSEIGPLVYSYQYDDNGSRTKKWQGAMTTGTLLQDISYDQKRRATQINVTTQTNNYQYDVNNYRTGKQDSSGENEYLLEGEHLEATYGELNTLKAKYLRGTVVDEIVNGYDYDQQGNEVNQTYHHDHVNSVRALTGHAGSTKETIQYSPFGNVQSQMGTSNNKLRYTGREQDEDTGLYYYRARYYDPEVGRFLTEDPLGFDAGDVNFYAYVGNNPINYNDPSGKIAFAIPLITGGIGAIAGAAGSAVGQAISGGFSDFSLTEVGVAAGVGFVAGAAAPFTATTLAGAAFTGGVANVAQLGISEVIDGNLGNVTIGDVALAGVAGLAGGAIGGSVTRSTGLHFSETSKFIAPAFARQLNLSSDLTTITAGSSVARNIGGAVASNIDFGVATTFDNLFSGAPVQTDLNFSPVEPINFSPAPSPFSANSAGGGFVLYPSKPNTNMLQSVYSK